MDIHDVITWLNAVLDPDSIKEYGPNGLQVHASEHVTKIATGVTSNMAFIEEATRWGAELAVVHHGIYWHGAPFTAVGSLGKRLQRLFASQLSLAAYHLPLDAHLEWGNAAGLARAIGAEGFQPAFPYKGYPTGLTARFPEPISVDTLRKRLQGISDRALLFEGGPSEIRTVGIVTGGAPRMATDAAALGLDLFITGEASEYSQAIAHEEKIHVAACGHHRTETFGAETLAEVLAERFPDVQTRFIDIDNPA